ncbi:protein BCCIP homolog [Actinia tenebrosa]|uniref:Protein BCCIP homolog n=1 Tax=Actinia tenebrosa TaxID=6105 RepID=A0A6P8H1U0_ACTTE|nr:protein BCCIP homolog [Actinia tenebrosa]
MASGNSENRGKKRQIKQAESDEDSSSDECSSEESASDENFDEDMEIPVEFEAFPPAECDFRAMRNLLKQLFLKDSIDLSELANLIISQEKIGSIIKVVEEDETEEEKEKKEDGPSTSKGEEEEYEEEILGLITILDLVQYQEKKCIQQIKQLLLHKCKSSADPETQTKFKDILDSNKRVGLLFSERFINIPPQIALPLYQALRAELEEQHKKDKGGTLKYLLVLSKSYKEKQTGQSKKSKGKKAAKLQEKKNQDLNFSNVEDEILNKESTIKFSYPVKVDEEEILLGGNWSFDDTLLEPYRTVMIIPYDRMSTIIEQMEQLLAS